MHLQREREAKENNDLAVKNVPEDEMGAKSRSPLLLSLHAGVRSAAALPSDLPFPLLLTPDGRSDRFGTGCARDLRRLGHVKLNGFEIKSSKQL